MAYLSSTSARIAPENYSSRVKSITVRVCINHGIKMNQAQAEIKKAVAAGYWTMYRYNPDLENPLTVDSKEPTGSYQDFIKGENRYASLLRQFPDVAPALFEESEAEAKKRLETYKRMAGK